MGEADKVGGVDVFWRVDRVIFFNFFFGIDLYEFHSLLNLKFLKIEKTSGDFAFALIFGFRDKFMGADVILLENEGVLFVKLVEEVFSFEFVEFFGGGRFLGGM